MEDANLAPPPRRFHQPVLDRLRRMVEGQIGAPCELHLPEPDLFRAALVRRHLTRVDLRAVEVPMGGREARATTLAVTLDGLDLRGPRLRPTVQASGGRFVATFGDEAIRELVDLPPVIDRVWLLDDALRVATVVGVAFDGDLGVEDEQVVIRPRRPGALAGPLPWRSLTRPLPEMPFGAHLETLRVDGGQVTASGFLEPGHLAWSL